MLVRLDLEPGHWWTGYGRRYPNRWGDVDDKTSTRVLRLEDEREIGVSLKWFPKLHKASDKQRDGWHLISNGIGIHWEALDEDLSVQALFD